MSVELAAAARILARQQSLITTAQAEDVGVNRKRRQRLVDPGVWERLETGVFGPAGVPLTWKRRLMVALLLAPPGSLASHRCAAALLEVGGIASPRPEITIPRGASLRRPWLTVHESTDLSLADRRRVDGIPITGPRRLAMDLGGVVPPRAVPPGASRSAVAARRALRRAAAHAPPPQAVRSKRRSGAAGLARPIRRHGRGG